VTSWQRSLLSAGRRPDRRAGDAATVGLAASPPADHRDLHAVGPAEAALLGPRRHVPLTRPA
jgi:hypothetical protein